MPTLQKPQLDHVSFPWHEQSNLFHRELEAQRAQILERSGFNREFGISGNPPSVNEEQEGTAFILASFLRPRPSIWTEDTSRPTKSSPP